MFKSRSIFLEKININKLRILILNLKLMALLYSTDNNRFMMLNKNIRSFSTPLHQSI